MARVLVGLSSLAGDIARYQKRFDMVELRPVDTAMPRAATLRSWRKSVAPGFVFSVVLPRVVGELAPGPELDRALADSLEVATAVQARCVVLATPASVRPTSTNKKRLAAVLERLPRSGVVVGWEPAGIWDADEVAGVARAAGVVAVLDAGREPIPAGPIAYTRLRALGKTAAMGAAILDAVSARLSGRREVFVVVDRVSEGQRVRAGLVAALTAPRRPGSTPLVVRPAGPSTLVAEDEEQ